MNHQQPDIVSDAESSTVKTAAKARKENSVDKSTTVVVAAVNEENDERTERLKARLNHACIGFDALAVVVKHQETAVEHRRLHQHEHLVREIRSLQGLLAEKEKEIGSYLTHN